MTGVLYGVARFCVRRRLVVLGVWLVVAVALVAVSHRMGDNTNDNLSLPGTGSQLATSALSKSFPDQANGSSPIVIHTKSGKLTDPRYANAINSAASDVAKAANVGSVVNPLTPQGASQLSKDQTTGYLAVTTSVSPGRCRSGRHRTSSTRPPSPRHRPVSRCRPAASSVRRCHRLRPNRAN